MRGEDGMKPKRKGRRALPGQEDLFAPARAAQTPPPIPLHPAAFRAGKARDKAMAAVERAADPHWQVQALNALRVTAEAKAEFISDDVWTVSGLPKTRDDRALGPVFRDGIRKGWIEKTQLLRPSVRSHLSGKPVWRSLLYKGT
jgi:hypothetical protein